MSDTSRKLEELSTRFDGLEETAAELGHHPEAAASVRRIARSLAAAAGTLDLHEVAAGAVAIQRAADGHLERSVANFLARIEELRAESLPSDGTVLLVEDNRTIAAATLAALESPGRRLLHAETADRAESMLADHDVDVIVLDLILPDRDGRDLLLQLREEAGTDRTPVVVVSATDSPVARAECRAVGADGFLVKPVEPRTLRSTVARQLQISRDRRREVVDGRTGLPNRAGLTAEFERVRRRTTADRHPLSVGLITIDSLAETTMKLGREAGDRLVMEVGTGLRARSADGVIVGRWEPSTLLALVPGETGQRAAELLEEAARGLLGTDPLDRFVDAGVPPVLSSGATLVNGAQSLRDAVSVAECSRAQVVLASAEPTHLDTTDPGDGAVDEVDADPLLPNTARVLVVEDDRVTGTLLHHRLVRDGHDVVDFPNGSDAFAWAETEAFDLAILDVKVPGMDGFELLSRLRQIPRLADVPIIMLTGMGSESDVIRGLELGANDYMLKPFSPTELLARVRRLLSTRGTTTGSQEPTPIDASAAEAAREARG